MSCLHLRNITFQLSFITLDLCKETNNIGLTTCQLQDDLKPLQPLAIWSRIYHELNMQVGCYSFHSDLKLTLYFSGLPTSFNHHLPLLFHISKLCLHNHRSKVGAKSNRAEWPRPHSICKLLWGSKNTITRESTATLPMQWSKPWSGMHIKSWSRPLKEAKKWSNVQLNVRESMSM